MTSLLDRIRVASPCEESWEDMLGDERLRHCQRCDHSVYDLSGLPELEATALLERAAGGESICARFRRRADGRVITADCPSQLREARRPSWIRRAAGLLVAILGVGLSSGCEDDSDQVMGKICPAPPSTEGHLTPDLAPLTTQVGGIGRRLPAAG